MVTRTKNLQGRAEGAELLIPSAKISLAPHQVNSYVWGTKEFTWGALRKYRLIYKKDKSKCLILNAWRLGTKSMCNA